MTGNVYIPKANMTNEINDHTSKKDADLEVVVRDEGDVEEISSPPPPESAISKDAGDTTKEFKPRRPSKVVLFLILCAVLLTGALLAIFLPESNKSRPYEWLFDDEELDLPYFSGKI